MLEFLFSFKPFYLVIPRIVYQMRSFQLVGAELASRPHDVDDGLSKGAGGFIFVDLRKDTGRAIKAYGKDSGDDDIEREIAAAIAVGEEGEESTSCRDEGGVRGIQ